MFLLMQKNLFQKMINIAEKLNKPIIVHSRKAEEDTIEIVQSSKLKKIIIAKLRTDMIFK